MGDQYTTFVASRFLIERDRTRRIFDPGFARLQTRKLRPVTCFSGKGATFEKISRESVAATTLNSFLHATGAFPANVSTAGCVCVCVYVRPECASIRFL